MSNRNVALKEKPYRKIYGTIFMAQGLGATPARWTCAHHTYGSDIEAFVAAQGSLEVIAEARQIEGVNARANAELIVHAVNEHEKHRPLIAELSGLLELCAAMDRLTPAQKQEAIFLCHKARRAMG